MNYYDGCPEKHTFTFRFDSNDGERHLEMSCGELFLGDILDRLKEFLQGCGYVVDGHLEVAPPWDDFEKRTADTQFDFSNIPNNNWPFAERKSGDAVYSPVVHPSEK
jgi:hypothetical protein